MDGDAIGAQSAVGVAISRPDVTGRRLADDRVDAHDARGRSPFTLSMGPFAASASTYWGGIDLNRTP